MRGTRTSSRTRPDARGSNGVDGPARRALRAGRRARQGARAIRTRRKLRWRSAPTSSAAEAGDDDEDAITGDLTGLVIRHMGRVADGAALPGRDSARATSWAATRLRACTARPMARRARRWLSTCSSRPAADDGPRRAPSRGGWSRLRVNVVAGDGRGAEPSRSTTSAIPSPLLQQLLESSAASVARGPGRRRPPAGPRAAARARRHGRRGGDRDARAAHAQGRSDSRSTAWTPG